MTGGGSKRGRELRVLNSLELMLCTPPTSSHSHGPLGLAAAVSACADQQVGTNFHRICEAQPLGNSLNAGLTGWLFECAYGRRRV